MQMLHGNAGQGLVVTDGGNILRHLRDLRPDCVMIKDKLTFELLLAKFGEHGQQEAVDSGRSLIAP